PIGLADDLSVGINATDVGQISSRVFVARGLTKIYRMGEVEVRALSNLDLEIRRENSSCCSDHRAAANLYCSTSWADSIRRRPARRSGATTIWSPRTKPSLPAIG